MLPITPLLPDVAAELRRGVSLVLEAPPGAGKTTAVPPALLELVEGEVIVLEPRRLAARLAARRVAEERHEEVGATVGYQVRFEDVGGPRTRLRYVTEAILLRRMLASPRLEGVGAVVLDEFHERHLHGDLALALARRLQAGARPDLRVVVMSATLAAEPVVAFLGGAARLRSEGRMFEVAVEHLPHPDDRRLEEQVASAVRRLMPLEGDVLVFLPGAAEIARARETCARLGVDVATLHGDLPPEEQDRAVRVGARPKVVLSTNVAESSVTLPGVVAVVDSGLARVASHSPWTGLPSLRVQKISQASAAQRAGRAGRLRPGRCLRLYTRHDLETRPAHELPEIRRADLAEAALYLHAAGERDLAAFGWFEAPDPAALAAAETLLARLGAVAGGALTPLGERLLSFPLHPRLGRMLVEGERRGVAEEAATIAAVLGERPERDRAPASGRSDLTDLVARGPAERARKQIARLARRSVRGDGGGGRGGRGGEDDVLISVLAGFPDRVARRRRPGEPEVLLAGGGSAVLSPSSVVRDAELMVVVDVEERQTGMRRNTVVRAASAIEPEWLLDLFSEALREERQVVWNEAGERVEVVSRLRYDELILEESRGAVTPADGESAAAVLFRAAQQRGAAAFVDGDALARWLARARFVAATFPEAGMSIPEPDEALREMCRDATSFAELRQRGLLSALRARAGHEKLVADMAPDRLTLRAGRGVTVHYEPDRPPWIESRLQDFFGMTRSPAVGGGRVPVVVHLLAPNGRAVQVTSDLGGFWTKHYPAVRKELMRRYPKHKWPEDPVGGS